MPALSAAKFVSFVRNKGAYLPGIGVAPTSKTDVPIGAGVTFEISKMKKDIPNHCLPLPRKQAIMKRIKWK